MRIKGKMENDKAEFDAKYLLTAVENNGYQAKIRNNVDKRLVAKLMFVITMGFARNGQTYKYVSCAEQILRKSLSWWFQCYSWFLVVSLACFDGMTFALLGYGSIAEIVCCHSCITNVYHKHIF